MAERRDRRRACWQAGEKGASSKARIGTITYTSRRDNIGPDNRGPDLPRLAQPPPFWRSKDIQQNGFGFLSSRQLLPEDMETPQRRTPGHEASPRRPAAPVPGGPGRSGP